MARPQALTPGAIFFLVHYYDHGRLVPDIQTLAYHSQEVEADGRTVWLFREPEGIPNPEAEEEIEADELYFTQFDESQLYRLLNIDELLGVVAELRHVIHAESRTSATAEQLAALDRALLSERVSTFLSSSSHSLRIGIRYTDDALALQKNAQGCELLLFMRPVREPARNAALDQLVRTRSVQVRKDYPASKGRQRVIALNVPAEPAALVDLCTDLFSNVFGIRAGDELTFHA